MLNVSISLLSMRDNLIDNINIINQSDADYIHLDIMDNKFVPYNSYSEDEIDTIINNSNKPLDVHLMVKDIDEYIDRYTLNNVKYITIHYEALKDLKEIEKINDKNIGVGISLKPSTEVSEIFDILDKIDLVLLMSVEPGKGGQAFIDSTYEKILKLKEEIKRRKLNIIISVDGGINDNNIGNIIECGAEMIVLGSYLNRTYNKESTIYNIKCCKFCK